MEGAVNDRKNSVSGMDEIPSLKQIENIDLLCNLFSKLNTHSEEQNFEDEKKKIINILTDFRNSLCNQPEIQKFLCNSEKFILCISNILIYKMEEADCIIRKLAWQVIANICVQNKDTQKVIWNLLGQKTLNVLNQSKIREKNVLLMILYNIYVGEDVTTTTDRKNIFSLLLKCWTLYLSSTDIEPEEYWLIFMEHILINSSELISLWSSLDPCDKTLYLKYVISYLKNEDEIHSIPQIFLQTLIKELINLSDEVLNNKVHRNGANTSVELFYLVNLISDLSCHEKYISTVKDGSLFINMCYFLKFLIKSGKESQNIFTPMQKLEEVAPNSNLESYNYEKDISYMIKTNLIRFIANLSYKDIKYQTMAHETQIIIDICDCTTFDARNPCIREWSIVAIRNLCEYKKNQEIVASLQKVSDDRSIIKEEIQIYRPS